MTGIRIQSLDSIIFDLEQLGISKKISPFIPSSRKGEPVPEILLDRMVYRGDEWLGGPLLSVDYEGIMRGMPMSTLHFNPVRYNPAKNQLKVYFDVSCIIETNLQTNRKQVPSKAFERLFGRVVRQNPGGTKKGILAEQPMTLVILSDTLFRETLQPFIQWKRKKGFKVEEAYLHDPAVGSSRKSIKSYLDILYHQPAEGVAPPAYVLIVGDVENFPLSQSGGQITDLYYATFDGEDDYIPDLFYGRISVTSENQLQHVLDKILEYEQYQFPDPSFLKESVLIAGVPTYDRIYTFRVYDATEGFR